MAANSCSPLWFRFFDHEPGWNGSHVQTRRRNRPRSAIPLSGQSQLRSLRLTELGLISSVWSARLFAFTSA